MPAALNLLVFRETRHPVGGPELKSALLRRLHSRGPRSTPQEFLDALLRAGELECAVADSGATPAEACMNVTDRLAEVWLDPGSAVDVTGLQSALAASPVPDVLELSTPEGFAYYALHPLAFAGVVAKIPGPAAAVAVIGIRTIGVTLSAVVAAAARARGLAAQRITVRPQGHPYDRITKFSFQQIDFIRKHADEHAVFLVVDEGPGLSGSTFISVGEALVEARVPSERIVLVCGREPDFDSLRARDGASRARRFRWIAVSSEPRRPRQAEIAIGGGQWRRHLLANEAVWPGSWTNLERLKYLSSARDERRLFKFIGFGHYGDPVCDREMQVAEAGFGPMPRRETEGFVSYPWVEGRPMAAEDISPEALTRLAAYCAFRVRAFRWDRTDLVALEQMAQHNAGELGVKGSSRLRLERPVLADGRMHPHEWLRTLSGQMLKTDSGSHGDDHFFPGITDIAWDLAGAIVEWNMSAEQAAAFLENYRRASGDDPGARIGGFVVAYTLFRCAYCRMAANALHSTREAKRLEEASSRYQAFLNQGSTRALFPSWP